MEHQPMPIRDRASSGSSETNDTMPNSGIGQHFSYRDRNRDHTGHRPIYSVQNKFALRTQALNGGNINLEPVEVTNDTPSAYSVLCPISDDLPERRWTFVRASWIPWQLRGRFSLTDPRHVLSIPVANYLLGLHDSEEERNANTIDLNDDLTYQEATEKFDAFRNGIINETAFAGYQMISERLQFDSRLSSNGSTFRLNNLKFEVFLSNNLVPGWRGTSDAMPNGKKISNIGENDSGIYGALADHQSSHLDGRPRLEYNISISVTHPDHPGNDPFAQKLTADFPSVWPADTQYAEGTDLVPAFAGSSTKSTYFSWNQNSGYILQINLSQQIDSDLIPGD